MQTNPLVNKTFLLMITQAEGSDVKHGNLSIQQGTLTTDGKYNVNCIAASEANADKEKRTGKYTTKEHTDKKTVIQFTEETGPYTGGYLVTIDWLNNNTGTWMGKRDGNGSTVKGVVKTME